jgi:cytoskeletal protein RodZ
MERPGAGEPPAGGQDSSRDEPADAERAGAQGDTPSAAAGDSSAAAGDSTRPTAPDEQTADERRPSRLPMPSPWAVAVAVLAVLAFGVAIGTVVAGHHKRPLLVLADEPSSAAPTSQTPVSTEPEAEGATTEAEAEAEESSLEVEEEPVSGSEAEEESESEASSEDSKAESKGSGSGSASNSESNTKSESESSGPLPPVKHVFLIVLGEQGFDSSWGASSKAPYLASTLREQGELIDNYYAIGKGDLANGVALMSGQGPTPQTEEDCPTYEALSPGSAGKEGQVLGGGCVYPSATQTLPSELEKAKLTWKAYVQGLEDAEGAAAKTCRHPALGEADPSHSASVSDPYVTWRNPFVYFASIAGGKACESDDVGLEQLSTDLKSSSTTPTVSYIAPDACDDGAEAACAPGKPSGLAPMDAFLEEVVPEIERSGAYREDGLILITFAEAQQSGASADSSGCCITSPYPNLEGPAASTATSSTTASASSAAAATASATSTATATATTATTTTTATATTTASSTSTSTTTASTTSTTSGGLPTGGGRVGLLLISQFVKANSTEVTGEYNHYSLLLSIESLFKLHPLGYAGASGLLGFEYSVYTAYE